MSDQSWTWLALALGIGALAAILGFVWALGAPGRRRPDREPAGEKIPPKSARAHDDARQAVTPVHDRHDVRHRADGMEIERDILKDIGVKPEAVGLNPENRRGPDYPIVDAPENHPKSDR